MMQLSVNNLNGLFTIYGPDSLLTPYGDMTLTCMCQIFLGVYGYFVDVTLAVIDHSILSIFLKNFTDNLLLFHLFRFHDRIILTKNYVIQQLQQRTLFLAIYIL